jgi:signal transduction histidine kinase
MLAQVSHELRTPLANLKLYGSLVGQRRALDPNIQRYCDVIDVETDRLATLIDNALICARDGYVSRSTTQVANPDEMTQSVVERFSPLLNSAESIALDLTVDVAVRFDLAAYESILINLLDNARKHAHGTIIRVRTELRNDLLVLSVEDDGVGLPRDVREDLYTAFSSGPRRDGFGLGLAACYAQVRAAGGDIQYYDGEPGARFVARLPVRETADIPPKPENVARQVEATECAS